MKSKEQKSKRKNTILFLVFDIAPVLAGLYGIFVSLTGGMEYVNSPDKRIVNAEVISVKHTYERDDDGDLTGEKWTATLRYTVDGKEYKTQKLKRFGYDLYVAEDIGLIAFTQDDYKFFIFGKTTRACVYRIADLRSYEYEEQTVKNGDKTEKKSMARLGFVNTEGLYEFLLPISDSREFEELKKYFDTLFGIQKTLGNAANTWKQQITAVKDITTGFNAAVKGEADADAKAAEAINSLDAAIYGDRTEWIRKADAALAAFNG